MNPDEISPPERERKIQLQQLRDAEAALRANLHMHCVDATGRAHMERAISHVREAHLALSHDGPARTVKQLLQDWEKVDRLMVKVAERRACSPVLQHIRD